MKRILGRNGGAGRRCGTRRTIRGLVLVLASLLAGLAPARAGSAPDFRAVTTAGDTLQLSDFRGRVVVVDFWATWCPPCREQLERLSALERDVPELVVLAVNVDSRRDKVEQYLRRVQMPRRVLLDPGGRIAAQYAPQAMPWTVLVDGRGGVVSARAGWDGASLPALTAQVRQLVAQVGAGPQPSTSAAMGSGR